MAGEFPLINFREKNTVDIFTITSLARTAADSLITVLCHEPQKSTSYHVKTPQNGPRKFLRYA